MGIYGGKSLLLNSHRARKLHARVKTFVPHNSFKNGN